MWSHMIPHDLDDGSATAPQIIVLIVLILLIVLIVDLVLIVFIILIVFIVLVALVIFIPLIVLFISYIYACISLSPKLEFVFSILLDRD